MHSIGGETAKTYLNAVLDLIQEQAYFVENISDWSVERQKAQIMIANAKTPADTHRAIQMILDKMGHAFFMPPPENGDQVSLHHDNLSHGMTILPQEKIIAHVTSGGAADDAGLEPGDRIIAIDHQAVKDTTEVLNLDPSAPLRLTCWRPSTSETIITLVPPRPIASHILFEGRPIEGFGYLAIAGMNPATNPEEYVSAAAQMLSDISHERPRGWILDLRLTGGKLLWPVLLSIGAILGSGEFGQLIQRPNKKIKWTYDAGKLNFGEEQVGKMPDLFTLPDFGSYPLAVLISPLTRSVGEMATIASMGREQTRLIGEPTHGSPTQHTCYTLSDGAQLCLTTAVAADRHGQIYLDRINPDETVATDWTTIGSDSDAVIQAAIAWLKTTI